MINSFFRPTGIEFEIHINALDNEKPVFSTTRLLSLEPEKIITRIIYTLVITELRFGLDHRFTGPDNRFHALRSKFSYHSSLATPLPLKRSSFQPFHMLNALAHAVREVVIQTNLITRGRQAKLILIRLCIHIFYYFQQTTNLL